MDQDEYIQQKFQDILTGHTLSLAVEIGEKSKEFFIYWKLLLHWMSQ